VEAMDANRAGALVAGSELGPRDLLRMVRGTVPVNTGSAQVVCANFAPQAASTHSSRLLD
jgi:hypothetical protein